MDIGVLLKNTLDPRTRKEAESVLAGYESQQGFALALLELVCASQDETVRACAVLYFKNLLKRGWAQMQMEGEPELISAQDKAVIKEKIITAMTIVPSKLQTQLSDAVAIIADSDFPDQWPTLISELVKKLDMNNIGVVNGVLRTAHSVFARWKRGFLDTTMAQEIIGVLDIFIEPYRQVFLQTHQLIEQHKSNPATLALLFETLDLIIQIFHDFNYHEIPAFFEDNHLQLMQLFHHYLTTPFPILETNDDTPGPLEKVRSGIAMIVEMYAKRHEEEFTTLPMFIESIWKILTAIGIDEKHDEFVSKSLQFLTTIVKLPRHAVYFNDATISEILEKIVVPNLQIRECDVESFEDDPLGWIRRDVDGDEGESRRKSGLELVKGLVEQFGELVMRKGAEIVGGLLKVYEEKKDWRAKDTALCLVCGLVVKAQTAKSGAVQINENIQIQPIFISHVIPDLSAPVDGIHPILKVNAIKFVLLFRTLLEKSEVQQLLPILLKHLEARDVVVQTYASICIERILAIRDGSVYRFTGLGGVGEALVRILVGKIGRGENEYLMRAISRVIQISQGDTPMVPELVQALVSIIQVICVNPSNPQYNHYVFESVSSLVKYIGTRDASTIPQFEAVLMPVFGQILEKGVTEFTPYVIQIIALMVEMGEGLADRYKEMVNSFLMPVYWESQGNVPALIKLIQSVMIKDPGYVAAHSLNAVLGVFQRLVNTRYVEEGFLLLMSVFENIPNEALMQYITPILGMLFGKMSGSKNVRLRTGFSTWLLNWVAIEKMPADDIIKCVDAVNPGVPNLFEKVYSGVILSSLGEVLSIENRRICAVGLARLCFCSRVILTDAYIPHWANAIEQLSNLTQTRMLDTEKKEELEEEYQTNFARLSAASGPRRTKFSNLDLKLFVQELVNKSPYAAQVRELLGKVDPSVTAVFV